MNPGTVAVWSYERLVMEIGETTREEMSGKRVNVDRVATEYTRTGREKLDFADGLWL